MVITKAADCANISITSDYLTVTNQLVKLTVKLNCGDEYIINYEPEDDPLVVEPEDISSDEEVLADGIYYLQLDITQENGDKVTESDCIFMNCVTACLMVDSFKTMSTDKNAAIKAMAYHALIASEDCNSCTCADMCLLYNTATDTTCSSSTTTTNASTGCGCS